MRLDNDVARTSRAALQLSALIGQASEAQWQRSKVITDPDDPGIRGKGEHSDPTFDVVADPLRQNVRKAEQRARQTLERAQRAMEGAALALQNALDEWNGGLVG